MNIYQMIKKKSSCFTMTIFLMFKIKLVRLKCPLAYAWVKNNVPSNFQLSFLDIDESLSTQELFSLTEMTLSVKFPSMGKKEIFDSFQYNLLF